MQFKTHTAKDGSISWSVVRWTYDASNKRSRPTSIGTITEAQLKTAHRVESLMLDGRLNEPAERAELAAWYAATRAPIAFEMHRRWLLRGLIDSSMIVEAIESGHCTSELAAVLWERIDRVTASLRKAKFNRPKPGIVVAGDRDVGASKPAPAEAVADASGR